MGLLPPKYENVLRFSSCALGICLCYWFYGFLQENLLTNSGLGATLVLVFQTLTNAFVAFLWRSVESSGDQKNAKQTNSLASLNHPLLGLVASVYVLAMTASNESLQFVSYPTAVLAKSCKMIPTMVMGTLVERRRYSPQMWVSALCISFGIAAFNLSRIKDNNQGTTDNSHDDDAQQPDNYWKGMSLLCFSLCMDGFLGSFQGMLKYKDETGKQRPPTAVETMFFVNFYALLLLVPMAMVSGQWAEGIQLLRHDSNLLRNVALLNGVVSIGQIFIFLTIHWYSSLVCTTITTTRKFFTILFSVLHFGHKFSTMQWVSVGLVFGGLYLSIVSPTDSGHEKSPRKKEKKV